MAARFEVYKDVNKKWRFRLKAGNNEIIATSEAYESKQGCLKGVASVQLNAGKAMIEILGEIKEDISKKGLIKKIKKQEKIYKNPENDQLKPPEEIRDENKLLKTEPNAIKNIIGPRWL